MAGSSADEARPAGLRRWTVGGALIRHGSGLVMVANRRRDGSIDWTPPGGVIDAGESIQDGLAREVREETGLHVHTWGALAYRVEVEAPDMGWHLTVEAWEVEAGGDLGIDDPDGIVEHARGVERDETLLLIETSPPWVRVPVGEWLDRCDRDPREVDAEAPADYHFRLVGAEAASASVHRVA